MNFVENVRGYPNFFPDTGVMMLVGQASMHY